MLFAQARTETVLALRNGEQVLLTLLIPVALLIGLTVLTIIAERKSRTAAMTYFQ